MYSPFYYANEIYTRVTRDMVPDIDENRYWISNYGNVYDSNSNRFMSINQYPSGYLFVSLHTSNGFKKILLHRLVGFAFIPGDRSLQINHKNGYKDDCYEENLEWVTARENLIHAVETGLNHRGEDKCNAKITNNQAKLICEGLEKRYRVPQILKLANLEDNDTNRGIIADIKRGQTYSFISKNYNIDHLALRDRELTNEQVHYICKLFESNPYITYPEVLLLLGYGNLQGTDRRRILSKIGSIKLRKAYTDISKNYNW